MKGLLRIVGLFLPHFFAAALSCRKSTDKRLIKFFLPYGMMRRRMRDVFGEEVGSREKDRGLSGLFRSACPYGLVLWWDDKPLVLQQSQSRRCSPKPVSAPSIAVVKELEGLRYELSEFKEQMELIVLRAMTRKEDLA